MTTTERIGILENELQKALQEQKRQQKELEIVKKQLALKDRHLQILLSNTTIVLSAFSKDGEMELNIGKGLDVPNVNADFYKSAYLGYSLEQLEKIMPHIIQAVRASFELKIVTYAQTITPSGKIFYVSLVPYINEIGEVEYVYSCALRVPEPEEIDQKHYYTGHLNLPQL